MTRVAIIPAKRHSRRVPGKNWREFLGKPMLAWSVEVAKSSGLFQTIAVSTDDGRVAEIAKRHGARVLLRPKRFTWNAVGTQEVAQYALRQLGLARGFACCLYACAPLLEPQDLRRGFDALLGSGRRYAYVPGIYYWGRVEEFLSRPELGDDSLELTDMGERAIDIDTMDDWVMAEALAERTRGEPACA